MNYSFTLWSLFTPHTHTHTPRSIASSSSIMVYCYILRMTLGVRHTAIGIYLSQNHDILENQVQGPPLHLPRPDNTDIMLRLLLRIGLFGRTDPSLDRCWSFDHESRPTTRLCVDYRLRQFDPVPFTRRCTS